MAMIVCSVCGREFLPHTLHQTICVTCYRKAEASEISKEVQQDEGVIHPASSPVTTPPAAKVAATKRFNSSSRADRSRKDAERLYTVSDTVYGILIFFNWIVGIAGGISAVVMFASASGVNSSFPLAFGIMGLVCTGLICAFNYGFAVLFTHFAKVLSNISLSLLEGED